MDGLVAGVCFFVGGVFGLVVGLYLALSATDEKIQLFQAEAAAAQEETVRVERQLNSILDEEGCKWRAGKR